MFLRRGSRHFLISIHAPREGGDDGETYWKDKNTISIHAPREGGDYQNHPHKADNDIFQSTPPARGATVYSIAILRVMT